MSSFNLVESPFDPKAAVVDAVVNAGDPWLHEIRKGQVIRQETRHASDDVSTQQIQQSAPLGRAEDEP